MLCQQYNLSENLPKNIQYELNEIYPIANSEISFFMANTKYCHELFYKDRGWDHRIIKNQNKPIQEF
jgi:hypothetical protein|tara:strand:+ start:206 stop:406 length:201 start_codon:yes stop_codon:yes gene_type:complete